MNRCNRCKVEKPSTEFNRLGDGLQKKCRDCQKEINAMHRAIKSGVLIRPNSCSKCGTDRWPIHAHHDDYSRPLHVRWLCAPCHVSLHTEARKEQAA